MSGDPTLERIAQGNGLALCAAGSWTARFAPVLERMVTDAEKLRGSRPNIFIDVSQVSKLDTFGAWLIERLRRSLTDGGVENGASGTRKSRDLSFSPGDLDEVVATFVATDATTDRASSSTVDRGSVFTRVTLFRTGFERGANACFSS